MFKHVYTYVCVYLGRTADRAAENEHTEQMCEIGENGESSSARKDFF